MKTKVHELRKNGYKVRVIHKRKLNNNDRNLYHRREIKFSENISPKGGQTTVEILTPDGREFSETAKCSHLDSFNRKVGITIALGRIAKKNGLDF